MSLTNPKVSLCIPIHDSEDTPYFLSRLLASVSRQTFKDYELVITKEGKFARNHNAAIQRAKGEIVQMLQRDDYFASPDSLQRIVDGFTEGVVWQITGCLHDNGTNIGNPHIPYWTDDIFTGNNRLGSVSTLSFMREKGLLFEEPLQWLVDVDLYYRLYLKYGYPHLNPNCELVINTKNGRLTDTIPTIDKENEYQYLLQKYGH